MLFIVANDNDAATAQCMFARQRMFLATLSACSTSILILMLMSMLISRPLYNDIYRK